MGLFIDGARTPKVGRQVAPLTYPDGTDAEPRRHGAQFPDQRRGHPMSVASRFKERAEDVQSVAVAFEVDPGDQFALEQKRPVQYRAVVGAESAEHRRVMRPHHYRNRIQLEHIDFRYQTAELRPINRTGGPAREPLRGDGDPARLGGRQPAHTDR